MGPPVPRLDPPMFLVSSEGSGETFHMYKLTLAFAGCQGDTCHLHNYSVKVNLFSHVASDKDSGFFKLS